VKFGGSGVGDVAAGETLGSFAPALLVWQCIMIKAPYAILPYVVSHNPAP
jgi:hypothetical protein